MVSDRKELGGTTAFLVVVILLVGLLVGGIYLAKNQSRRGGVSTIDVSKTAKPDETKNNEESPGVKNNIVTDTKEREKDDKTTVNKSTPKSTGEVAQAGPTETLSSLLGSILVTFSLMSFIQSRRV